MNKPEWAGRLFDGDVRRLFPDPLLPRLIVGADEVGAGAWAGPFTVCAVLAPLEWNFEGLKDSKKLGPTRCAKVAAAMLKTGSFRYAVRHTSSVVINAVGPRLALQHTFEDAVGAVLLQLAPEYLQAVRVVLDGDVAIDRPDLSCVSLPKADSKVPHVMAASVIAKAQRDAVMVGLDELVPGYGFSSHSGYGTKKHREALERLGPSDVHRFNYEPIRRLLRTGKC